MDFDFSGQGKLETVAALEGEGDDGVGGFTFNSLIEFAPPLFSNVFQQASCLQREACPYVPSAASATPELHSPAFPASMSEPPIVLALSDLARPDPDAVFVKTFPLVSPVLVSPVTAPASVFNKTSRLLARAPAIRAAARTSGLSSPHLASAQLQPASETRSLLLPAPTGTYPIAHLANITGAAISAATNINTFIKGFQFQTIAAPPSSYNHPDQSLLQSLATSGFPAAAGKPWSLGAIRA